MTGGADAGEGYRAEEKEKSLAHLETMGGQLVDGKVAGSARPVDLGPSWLPY